MKQKLLTVFRWVVVGGCFLGLALPAFAETNQIRALIVTGQDWPGHLWKETAPALRQLLEEDKRVTVRIVEDPHMLDTAALTNYSVVLLHFQNWQQPGPGAVARTNLQRFVAGGGGLMSVHFACGAWINLQSELANEWPEFANIIGRVWDPKLRGHDPRGKFTVQIVDAEHPVTRGLKDFETDDELYTCLVGDAPIHLLAKAKSVVDHKEHPMAFTHEYGKGRVFLTTLGHDVKGYTNACTAQMLRQASAWVARVDP